MGNEHGEENTFGIRERIDEGAVSIRQLFIVGICFAINFADGFDVIAMSVTAPIVSRQMGIQPSELGAVFSAALFGMAIGSLVLAPLSDKVGRRSIILHSVFAISLSMLLTAFAGALWQLVSLRFLTGIGIGAVLASATSITSEFIPERRRSLAIILVATGFTVGTVVVGPLAGYLISNRGWQSVFLVGASIGFVTLLTALFLLPESIEYTASTARGTENRLVLVNAALAKIKLPPLEILPGLEDIDRHSNGGICALLNGKYVRDTLLVWALFFSVYWAVYFLLNWVPQLFSIAGFELGQSIVALTTLTFGGLLGAWFIGAVTSWLNLNSIVSAMLLAAALLMSVYYFVRPEAAYTNYVFMFCVGFTLNGGLTALYAVVSQIYPIAYRATGIGWAIGIGRFGAIFSPLLAGYVIGADVNMYDSILLLGVPAAVFGVIAIRLLK